MTSESAQEAPAFALYNGQRQIETFCRIDQFLPTANMAASSTPRELPKGAPISLPETYEFEGETRSTATLLEETDTVAMIVLRDGDVKLEEYWLTGGADVPWTSFSMAKSFVSTLVGIAHKDGLIRSLDDPISKYLSVPAGSAYDGVKIIDVLEMSSGARWNEDYSDPEADIHKVSAVMAGMSTLDEFIASMVKEVEPGTRCLYNSADTQALGMMLSAASGMPLAQYMQEKLCEPLGFEFESKWVTDKVGTPLALGGLHMTARDFAKLGLMALNKGRVGDTQLVPEAWIEAATKANKPHTQPGHVLVGTHAFPFGYGYQWWIMPDGSGDFSAIGVYNQFVYISPATNTVVVKLSANPKYGTSDVESDNKDHENAAFIKAVISSI